jgi:hypothetical protein
MRSSGERLAHEIMDGNRALGERGERGAGKRGPSAGEGKRRLTGKFVPRELMNFDVHSFGI